MPEPAAPPTPLSPQERAAFRRRRAALTAGVYGSMLPLGAMYLFPAWAQARPWLFQAYTALVLGLLVAFLMGWRCPRCRSILFGRMNPRFCPRCGVALEAGPPGAA